MATLGCKALRLWGLQSSKVRRHFRHEGFRVSGLRCEAHKASGCGRVAGPLNLDPSHSPSALAPKPYVGRSNCAAAESVLQARQLLGGGGKPLNGPKVDANSTK